DQLTGIHRQSVRLASAVAETMRLEPGIPIIPRTTIAPVELCGTNVAAGSMVFLCTAAAGRDASAWPDPDRFDPDRFTRPKTPRPLSFGAGAHYCLGASLAKIVLEECMRAVLSADPLLRLDEDPADIPWRVVLGRCPSRLLVSAEPPLR